MIGFCGSHRTGKTTLAESLANHLDLFFLKTKTSDVVRDLGYDSVSEYDFDTRLKIQNAILESLASQYMSVPHGKLAITDRTPLDVLMYTIAEIGRGAIKTEAQQQAFDRHRTRALELCQFHFIAMVRLQPGIPIVDVEGKAPTIRAYMDHLNTILTGLIHERTVQVSFIDVPRDLVEFPLRFKAVQYHIVDILSNANTQFRKAS